LTPGVNFINVLRTNFSYERRFSSYVLALSKNLYKKFARLTLIKLTPGDFEGVRGVRFLRRHTSGELSRELPQSDGQVLDDR